MRILLVEDDPILSDALKAHLRRARHAVDLFATASDADLALRTTQYDIVLLDLGLPDGSGLAVLKGMRQRDDQTPVIVATANDRINDRIEGLNAGADDYLVKPYDLNELVARVKAIARRTAPIAKPDFERGDVVIDLDSHRAIREGRAVSLTAREWSVLELLIARPGAVVSKEDIESKMYQFGAEIDSNSVEVFISRIRKKLGRSLITTERGLGYRLSTS